MINVLSLFDGISTGRLAFHNVNRPVKYFASEIDKNAIEISKSNWDDITYLGDVNDIDVKALGKIDLLIGGSPCQGFSRAGKGLNFEDPRSVLFFKYADVLKEIRSYNHDVKFFLENVHMKKEWIEVITEALGVEPVDINSKVLSGQSRPRLYWTNIEGVEIEEVTENLSDVLEDNVDTSDYINLNGVLIDPAISENERDLIAVVNGEVRIKQATKLGYIVANDGDGINLSFPTSKTRRGRVIRQKSPTLDCQCNVCVYTNGVIRKLTITEKERLQTLPDNYTGKCGFSEVIRSKVIGNGWTERVVRQYFKAL